MSATAERRAPSGDRRAFMEREARARLRFEDQGFAEHAGWGHGALVVVASRADYHCDCGHRCVGSAAIWEHVATAHPPTEQADLFGGAP